MHAPTNIVRLMILEAETALTFAMYCVGNAGIVGSASTCFLYKIIAIVSIGKHHGANESDFCNEKKSGLHG